jgi:DNA invertase Pin-like site-specific DNA recombinase
MRLDRNGQKRGQPSSHRHPNAMLTEEQVRTIRRMYQAGEPARLLAAAHGLSRQTLHRVLARQSYREVTP